MSANPCPPEEGLLVVPRRGQWVMMVSLIFFIGPTIDALGKLSGVRLVACLALAAVFVVLYWRVMVGGWVIRDRRSDDESHAQALIGVLCAVAVGLAALGGPADWSGTWCFIAAATGLRVERRYAIPALFVLAAAAAGTAAIDTTDAAGPISLFVVTIGVGLLTGGFRRLRVVSRMLNDARGEIGRLAVADERLRFARDLHDLLGHSLSVIALKSELANRLIQDHPDQAAEHMRDIEAVTRRALSEVRDAVAGYRRPLLDAELAGARSTLAAAGIEVEAAPTPTVELPPDAEAVLAWAVREGATNVLRHSDARHVRISVAVGARDAALELIDDGRGVCPETAAASDGTGLAGLAERVARVRGVLDAAPRPDGDGFRLSVTVPLEAVT